MKNMLHIVANKPSIMEGVTKSAIENFAKLVSTEIYVVPKFQRDYSWKETNWSELWQDVRSIFDGNKKERFMGYVVLLQEGNLNYIIDGQQRLTTMSLMILAFIKYIKGLNDEDSLRQIQLLKTKYIAEQGAKKTDYIIKLELNEYNNDLYKSLVMEQPMSRRKFNASEKLMQKCIDWFSTKIPDLKLETSEEVSTAVIAFASSLYFATLNVNNDVNAYEVFETLNARGVKLSSNDLLKNYLFQIISPKGERELTKIENKWRAIVGIIGSEELVDFIRYYWNSRKKLVRKVDLYRAIKEANKTPEAVFELVDNLLASAEIYAALNDYSDSLWNGDEGVKDNILALKIFRLKQPYVVLLIGKEVLDDNSFRKLLTYCVAFSFRYNVICDLSANDQEFFYNDIALIIATTKKFKESDFKKLYPIDEDFLNNFTKKTFSYTTPNMKIVRFILASIERFVISNKIAIPLQGSKLTIEHIMPQSKGKWIITDELHKQLVNRLGNMTILTQSDQGKTKDYSFDIKAKVFKGSGYQITKEIITTSKHGWDKTAIEQRQEWLAKKANAIWVIPNI